MKILIVEDERRMVELLRRGLQEEGHTVVSAFDAVDSVGLACTHEFDVILLDLMMPGMDGYEVAATLRQQNVATPIIMLTARDTVPDIVRGLDVGADDYVTKPFSYEELLARLRAVRRRVEVGGGQRFQVGDLRLDPISRDVSRAGVPIALTRTEYNLIELLIGRSGKVVRRQALIEAGWGCDKEVGDNTLDAFMHLLRSKIECEGRPRLIHTVRGVGYALKPDDMS